MEYLDVVDQKDNVVGKASKEEVYKKRLRHRIAHIMIFNKKGELALQLRGKVSFCPYHWSTAVGGHVRSGETYEEAALREYEEELGVKSNIEFFSKDIYHYQAQDIEKILVTFKTIYEGPFEINPSDVEKIEFFDMKTVQKMIDRGEKFHPELLFLLRKHFGIK